jgi:hypothetical protein
MESSVFTEAEFRELWRLQRFYWKEAIRCEKSKAYLAGCVMLGSARRPLGRGTEDPQNSFDQGKLETPTQMGFSGTPRRHESRWLAA